MKPTVAAASLLLSAVVATPALADGQLWLIASTRGEIADGVLLIADANLHMNEAANHLGHVQLRGFLGHEIGKVTLAAGYSWVRSSKPGKAWRDEHRFTQQLEWKMVQQPGWRLSARTRLEQRLYNDADGTSWRLRQQLKLSVPIDDTGLALLTHGELFAALNDGPSGARGGDIDTRVFGGFSIPMTRKAALEVGYMNQHQWQRAKTTNHILHMTVSTKF